jgi:D-alanyl-D-alanine carboxypeptidase
VYSGFRPPWYQKRLFDQAVAKYGSVAKARKWVAPPGKSRHGRKGGQGAVDATLGGQLDGSSERLFRPMSWEEWHVQLAGTRDVPEDEEEEPDLTEPTPEELADSGITMDDVDEAIALLLEKVEIKDEAGEYEDADAGYAREAVQDR